MSPAGWLLLAASVGVVVALNGFCYARLLRKRI